MKTLGRSVEYSVRELAWDLDWYSVCSPISYSVSDMINTSVVTLVNNTIRILIWHSIKGL